MIEKNRFVETRPDDCRLMEPIADIIEEYKKELGFYGFELLRLTKKQLDALISGKVLGVDIQDEYRLGIIMDDQQ